MSKILQFKITLKGSNPKIWRRFQVEDSFMFYDLHLIIQNVMGWTNSHLYQFIYERNSFIGNPELLDADDIADDKDTVLSAIFDKPKIKMQYDYDFGDGWGHELVVEKILEKNPKQFYPFCLKGEMNCPPDDCGGIYGFYDKIDALKNKKHPDHEDVVEWMGDEYDPESFDLETVNENLKNYTDIDFGSN
ncbi:MAG: plasmid pRiA4b ORF-3 family protein [Bacteroidia bacterium]